MRKIPFPQANNLDRIYELFCNFKEDGMDVNEVADIYNLTRRQGGYYIDALFYIGYLEKHNIKFFLNHEGILTNRLDEKDRKVAFAKKILNNELLGNIYINARFIDNREEKVQYITNRIKEVTGLNINTSARRASTIISWFDWIDKV